MPDDFSELSPAFGHSEQDSKSVLRKRLRALLKCLSPEDVHRRSMEATRHLLATPEYRRAETVMVFLSLPTEVDTTSIVLDCWRNKKRVVAPQVSYEVRRMLPIELSSFSDLRHDDLGVRQPMRGAPMPLEIIDLILVPGLGFDNAGRRIGRGGGFYDRFLASPMLHASACGLAFDEQFVANVPTGALDRRVDLLVTDVGVRRFEVAAQ